MFSTAFYIERSNWKANQQNGASGSSITCSKNSAANYCSSKLSLRFRKPKAASPALRNLQNG
eukprot:8294946-Ditylum_brightwellii.AAC.1